MKTRIEYLEARKLRLTARLEGVEHDIRFERHRIEDRDVAALRAEIDGETPLTVVQRSLDTLPADFPARLERRIASLLRLRRGSDS